MTDIPVLKAQLLETFDCGGHTDEERALVRLVAEALSRLTVSPLPKEIAWRVARLQAHAEYLDIASLQATGTFIRESAAALEQMARENERLSNGNEELKRMCEHFSGLHEFASGRIRELEAERDKLGIQNSNLYNEAQALQAEKRKQAEWLQAAHKEMGAIKAKTIEECARVADRHPWPTKTAESMWGIERAAIALAIRALNQPPEAES